MGRGKDSWIERTGGFRSGETQQAFQTRVTEIERLEQEFMSPKHNMEQREAIQRRLCELKGIDFDSYDDPDE